MNDFIAKLKRLSAMLLAVMLVALLAVPAFAASTESKYDADGHPIDKSQELQSLGDQGGTTEAERADQVNRTIEYYAESSMDDGTIRSMEETRQKLQEFRDSYYGDEGQSGQRSAQDTALGESEKYADVDASRIFSAEGEQSYGIINAGSEILNILINAVLLPAAILVVSWKTLYIGIFPVLAGVDPLKQLDSKQGSRGATRGRSGDIRGRGQEAIKDEVKKLLFGLLIVFVVWVIIRVAILIAVTVLSMF